jgi:hypothetical protein
MGKSHRRKAISAFLQKYSKALTTNKPGGINVTYDGPAALLVNSTGDFVVTVTNHTTNYYTLKRVDHFPT